MHGRNKRKAKTAWKDGVDDDWVSGCPATTELWLVASSLADVADPTRWAGELPATKYESVKAEC